MNTQQHTILQASDYERHAKTALDAAVYAYIAGASGNERTLDANRQAFDRVLLQQRAFAEFKQASTQTKLLGKSLKHPIFMAPVAAQTLVHPEGEIATAQAADAMDAGMILSTRTAKPMQSVSEAIQSNKWFQLYFQPEQQTTLRLVQQAEQLGFEAIVMTLDTPIQSPSIRAQHAQFQLPDYALPAELNSATPPTIEISQTDSVIFQGLMRDAPKLKDIAWLKDQTTLPILIKGVMAADEIERLLTLGVAGFIVSNHGGRALDDTPDSLTLLKHFRSIVSHDTPLLLDSGIRSGYDIFKALALGANAVCIGRLQV